MYGSYNYEAAGAAMDSFVTRRPPRAPQQMDPAFSVEATFHNYHLQEKHYSYHPQRSSSQPRSYQSMDHMHISTRSSSQPRSSHNAHFLDGFNVADCFDVRAIPDPPSPCHSKSRHRRRVSSAVLRPMSSRDITNRGNNQGLGMIDAADAGTKSSSSVRRKRKTLSHVPSPIIPGEEQPIEFDTPTEARPNLLHINLCHDDNARGSPKRRKKRQSMVIPTDMPLAANTERTRSPSKSGMDSDSPLGGKTTSFLGDFESMQKLRNLVRGYCALSSETDRGTSDEAKEIERLTGYKLPTIKPMDNTMDRSQSVLSNRRLVIQKIAPVLSQMEKRRERDTKDWERKTGCRVTKSERSGRFRYFDIETNERVGSQEYKRRYISILEEGRPERFHKAQAWMDKLQEEKEGNHAEHFPEYDDSFSIDMGQEDYNLKQAFTPPRDNKLKRAERIESANPMEICDLSMSLDYGEQQSSDVSMVNDHYHPTTSPATEDSESKEIAEISEASSEDTDDNSHESSRSCTPIELEGAIVDVDSRVSVVEAQDDDGSLKMEKSEKDDTKPLPLLPFPSRDTASMDPDIAAAEKLLWDKIDLALHEYSAEVMRIEEKKRLVESHRLIGERKPT